jgi:hypothetical protein
MADDPTTLAAVLVTALILLFGGLLIGDGPFKRRIGRWRQPAQAPLTHDDLALVVLIALAVAFCLLAQ